MSTFRLNFNLVQDHHYSLTEIEDMMPWEREIHTLLVMERIRKKEQQANGQ
mgnify:CR=1 FL=1